MKDMRKPTPRESIDPSLEKLPDSRARAGIREGKSTDRSASVVRSGSWLRSRFPFRTRLFAILLLFAVVPTIVVTLFWTGTANQAISMMSAGSAWQRVAQTGEAAMDAAKLNSPSPEQLRAIEAHQAELRQSVELATRFEFVANRTMRLILLGALLLVLIVAVGASKVAGHLSRQLSRPLDELVGWTALIRRAQPIPERASPRGAPEFDVLRKGMRVMAAELESGRKQAIESERAEAFRESARRFAHELKNPLTPIRFAVDRLRRQSPDELREIVDVLAEESGRLEAMARSFAQFGRLPDGIAAEIDIAELVTKTARTTVPPHIRMMLEVDNGLPMVVGYYEPLVRAVTNILLNAIDACLLQNCKPEKFRSEQAAPQMMVAVTSDSIGTQPAVRITVRDSGCGIAPEDIGGIFEPYVTSKAGGTGLGLAIARQTIAAHRGLIEVRSELGKGTELHLRIPTTGASGGTS